MPWKLPRNVCHTLRWILLSSSSEHSNLPMGAMSLLTAQPVMSSAQGSPGQPVTSTYRKPCTVKRGCQTSVPFPRSV